MRVSGAVWIDAKRDIRRGTTFRGRARHISQFLFALDVEQQDLAAKGELDLFRRLSDSGEDDARKRAPIRLLDAQQLAARNDVKAGARARHELQQGKVGVRF